MNHAPPADADPDLQENYYIETYPLSNCIHYWMFSMYGSTVNKNNYGAVQNALIVGAARIMLVDKNPMAKQYEIIHREFLKNCDELFQAGHISKEGQELLTKKMYKSKKGSLDGAALRSK